MKITPRFACAALVSLSAAFAQSSLEPFILRGHGSTLYRLELGFPLTGMADSVPENTEGMGQSELEYPLDLFAAGARYRHALKAAGSRSTGLSVAAWANVSQPDSKMKDTDWLGARASSGITTSSVLFKFSYTQSRAEIRWFGGEAGLDFGDYRLFDKPVRYGLSIRADRISYRLFGVEGWQRAPGNPSAILIDTLAGELVLTYGLTRVMPRLFADLTLVDGRRIGWKAVFTGAPAFAMDHDTHVLRRKESETSAFGLEAGVLTELRFPLSAQSALIASADLAYLRTKGSMDQHFYGDDPFTGERDETGMSVKDVETRIISLSGGFSLGIRYLF